MTIADQIAALRDKSTAELAAEFERLHGRPPRYRSPTWLRKRIAHALQVAAFGGLTRAARAALDAIQRDIALPAVPRAEPDRPSGELRVGTVLAREWRGTSIRVQVTADGFLHNGTTYASLSAAAFAITGSKWNGRLFFGLVDRKRG